MNNKLEGYKVVSLNCSFKASGVRHIDETMCFMPYGQGEYKVWIYKFRNIVYVDESLYTKSENTKKFLEDKKLIKNWKTIHTQATSDATDLVEERNKNGPPYSIFTTPDKVLLQITWLTLNKYFPCIDNQKVIDAIIDKKPVSYVLSIEEIKEHLEKERLSNLNIISTKLFGGIYLDCSHNFVELPIDLEVTTSGNGDLAYNITNIPIFNRLIIETKDIVKCIFSKGDKVDYEVEAIVAQQQQDIKSYINDDKPFDIQYYNTQRFNDGIGIGMTGANLHCLVKNQYVTMPKLD